VARAGVETFRVAPAQAHNARAWTSPCGPGTGMRVGGCWSPGSVGCEPHPCTPLQISGSPGQRSSTCPPSPEQVTLRPGCTAVTGTRSSPSSWPPLTLSKAQSHTAGPGKPCPQRGVLTEPGPLGVQGQGCLTLQGGRFSIRCTLCRRTLAVCRVADESGVCARSQPGLGAKPRASQQHRRSQPGRPLNMKIRAGKLTGTLFCRFQIK
jgi:hypothetical protein